LSKGIYSEQRAIKKIKGEDGSDIAKPDSITPEKINNSWKLFSDEIPTDLVT
jgi:hypothetical protein